MHIYLESSALISWLFDEPEGERARKAVAEANVVTISDLTLLECERAVIRGTVIGTLRSAKAERIRANLNAASSRWTILTLDSDILQRAAQPFPNEPLRTLDALHAAFALKLRATDSTVGVLTLDQRIRKVCIGLGLPVQPVE